MSTDAITTEDAAEVADEHGHEDGDHGHMSDMTVVKWGLVLAAITAVEVFTYFESVADWGKALVPSLLIMMFIKLWVVLGFYMHLKFDNKLFTQVFFGGVFFAVVFYTFMLLTFNLEVWQIFQE